jgi:hypothetical protein
MAEYDPIKISINNDTRAVLAAINQFETSRENNSNYYNKWNWLPLVMFLVGLPFPLFDIMLGYSTCLFSLVTPVLWLAALVVFFNLRSLRGRSLPPALAVAREVLYTLRDDVAPGKPVFGQIDLVGPQQTTKLVNQTQNALGLLVQYYRDEWFGLKVKLYDGNMLRFSAVERVKVRAGYSKRGRISGKTKFKPAKLKADYQELKVRISVNPAAYQIIPSAEVKTGARIGNYTLNMVDTTGGIISLSAVSEQQMVSSADILNLLRAAYSLLRPRVAGTV